MEWNLKKHFREKTHSRVLVMVIREGEAREICSASMKELLEIIKYHVEERSVIVVLNRESAIQKDASMGKHCHEVLAERYRRCRNESGHKQPMHSTTNQERFRTSRRVV